MGEYASVAAAMSALVVALVSLTVTAQSLPKSTGAAVKALSVSAPKLNVAPTVATGAFKTAPYKRVELRTLYAAAFAGSKGSPRDCTLAEAFGPPELGEVEQSIRSQPALVKRLQLARIPVPVAAKAVQRGTIDGCG
ncbi:MAG: hypothetical protein FJW96_02970 [Actinobacteria bacterium]|nr:hypothetical protein [Actinomycetota bacterium]